MLVLAMLFAGLATWVMHIFETELRKFNHLLLGTDDFVDRAKNMVITQNTVLYRADLKHFFMSGSPVDLTKACDVLPDGPRKLILQRVELWLFSTSVSCHLIILGVFGRWLSAVGWV